MVVPLPTISTTFRVSDMRQADKHSKHTSRIRYYYTLEPDDPGPGGASTPRHSVLSLSPALLVVLCLLLLSQPPCCQAKLLDFDKLTSKVNMMLNTIQRGLRVPSSRRGPANHTQLAKPAVVVQCPNSVQKASPADDDAGVCTEVCSDSALGAAPSASRRDRVRTSALSSGAQTSQTTVDGEDQWWNKDKDLWITVHTEEDFNREVSTGDKLVVVGKKGTLPALVVTELL